MSRKKKTQYVPAEPVSSDSDVQVMEKVKIPAAAVAQEEEEEEDETTIAARKAAQTASKDLEYGEEFRHPQITQQRKGVRKGGKTGMSIFSPQKFSCA